MPSRNSALAGALVSLPLLLSASSGNTQETWRNPPPRDDGYRPDTAPRYDDPDPNARPTDPYRPQRPGDAYSPPSRPGYAGAPGGYVPPPPADPYARPYSPPPGSYSPPPGSGYGSPYPPSRPAYG